MGQDDIVAILPLSSCPIHVTILTWSLLVILTAVQRDDSVSISLKVSTYKNRLLTGSAVVCAVHETANIEPYKFIDKRTKHVVYMSLGIHARSRGDFQAKIYVR